MVAEHHKINSDLVFKTAMMVLNSNCNNYFNNNSYSLFYISSIFDANCIKMWSSKQRFIFPSYLRLREFLVQWFKTKKNVLFNIIFNVCILAFAEHDTFIHIELKMYLQIFIYIRNLFLDFLYPYI